MGKILFDTDDNRRRYRHTASHIMAQAVKRLYPDVKLAIGPATNEGFYYDFECEKAFTKEDLDAIETEMKKIISQNLPIERFVLPRDEALTLMSNEPYKTELINDLPTDAEITFYRQGDFTDLCAGPHMERTGDIKAIKLLSEGGSSGAYWRGSEKNKMLARIYGTAFPDKKSLDAFIKAREDALKRDHNKLGRELKLFTTSEIIGQGLPLLMPKGARIVQILQRFIEDEEQKRGYVLTKTPFMSKSDLYKVSGHWDHYKDSMFLLGNEEKDSDVYALRPMTCPFQFVVYNAEQHSYRDLPIRYNETSSLFRNEESGEMHGLIRVRQFTLSEGHLVVRPDQLKDEFKGVVDLIQYIMKILGIDGDIWYRFSKWDANNKDKYIGDADMWEQTQDLMRAIIDEIGIKYVEADGEAAFYGPKLDIQTRNVYGKEDTIITIQIDFALAARFNMTYVDSDGAKKNPIIIHRSSLGCYERTLAMLVEKYAGAFPLWLAPVQAKVLSISEKFNDYAQKVSNQLTSYGLRIETDLRGEKIGFKIREGRLERVPYLIIVGEKEEAGGLISLWSRAAGDEGQTSIDTFIARANDEIARKVIIPLRQ
ncbi:MAG: threonine--tRNA ligase [Clostridiales bacterium]|jgi:threonyl-tRNA synthetase|nr:threonine--tRNA ligase [Clostridiales bacterium]